MTIVTETEYVSKEEQEAAESFNNAQSAQEKTLVQPSASIINGVNSIDLTTQKSDLENTEFKLTPEIKEKIMDKLKDIDAYGTAFSSVSFLSGHIFSGMRERFQDILKYGFLGTQGGGGDKDIDRRLKDWYRHARARNSFYSAVWFNIVGRMRDVPGKNQIDKSKTIPPDGIAVVFDINHFKELEPDQLNHLHWDENNRPKEHILDTFSSSMDMGGRGTEFLISRIRDRIVKNNSEKGNKYTYKNSPAQGFQIPFRIPPNLFQGVVVNALEPETMSAYIKTMIEAEKERPERLLPVYNTKGDLLWPEQMTHEKIKHLIADKKAMEAVRNQIEQA